NVESITVNTFSEQTAPKVYTIDSLTISEEKDEAGNVQKKVDSIALGENFPKAMEDYEVDDSFLILKGENGFEIKLDIKEAEAGTYTDLKVDITEIGPMRLQIGANEGQVLSVNIPEVSLRNMGIDDIDVSTEAGAKDALSRMPGALAYISNARGTLGAYQNRLESTVDSLDITEENMTAAYSRIMDVDMAEEMTNYTTYQVLTQAGTSMLAQANERPSMVLQLLQ
ncbi:MAG: flagellin FliC3, partial [Lachnospiraceae bacterium]|nr:flagellin FliC3 [Lachnospiraceae bacterium]